PDHHLHRAGGAGGEGSDVPRDGAGRRDAAAGGRHEGRVRGHGVGDHDRGSVHGAVVGVRQRVGDVGSGVHRVGRVRVGQRQHGAGGAGGGGGGGAAGAGRAAVDAGGAVGDRRAAGQGAGHLDDHLDRGGSAGVERTDVPGHAPGGECAPAGGG